MRDLRKEKENERKTIEKRVNGDSEDVERIKRNAISDIIKDFDEWMAKIKETPWYEEALESAIDEKRKRRKMKRLEKQYENAKQDYNDAHVVYREKIFQKSLNNPDRKDGGGRTERKMNRLKKEYENAIREYYDAHLTYRWQIFDMNDYHKSLEEGIEFKDWESKEKVINALNKISSEWFRAVKEEDGSNIIEFKLKWKKYKLLNINVEAHTDSKYYNDVMKRLSLWWMKWEVNERENDPLKKYVKEKQRRWFHIPKEEEMKELLNVLWEEAGITKEIDEIAMLMCLTGIWWEYWLENRDGSRRNTMWAYADRRGFGYEEEPYGFGKLCMIACIDE